MCSVELLIPLKEHHLLENRRKIEPQEIPSRLIACLLVVLTGQLEI